MKQKRKISKGYIFGVLFVAAFLALAGYFIVEDHNKKVRYDKAVKLLKEDNYKEAAEIFDELGSYSDSRKMIRICYRQLLDDYLENGRYAEGLEMYNDMPARDFKDSTFERSLKDKVRELKYREADRLYKAGNREAALEAFSDIGYNYKDVEKRYNDIKAEIEHIKAEEERQRKAKADEEKRSKIYDEAKALLDAPERKIIDAYKLLMTISGYKDAREIMEANVDEYFTALMEKKSYKDLISFAEKYNRKNELYYEACAAQGDLYFEKSDFNSAEDYYLKALGKVDGIDSRYEEARRNNVYKNAVANLNSGNIDTGLNLLESLDDSFRNVAELKRLGRKAQSYKRKWYLYKFIIESYATGRYTAYDDTYAEFGKTMQMSAYVTDDGRIRISMFGGSIYTDEGDTVQWDFSSGYCRFNINTGLYETFYLRNNGDVSSIYSRYYMQLDEGETLDPDLNPGICVTIQGVSSGGGSGRVSNDDDKPNSGKTDRETTTEFDPDDHDIEMYYLDYQDEFEDFDDAWDDFCDNPEYWDDY